MRTLVVHGVAIVLLGTLLYWGHVEAAQQRVVIRLEGLNCGFYLVDVANALKQVPGVRDVDLQSVQGHAVITMLAGKVSPSRLLSAIKSVKGDGYYCNGKFVGEPGFVEN
ncbi:MAG TPA: hypothetical protein VJM82_03745 [Nitrospiraceae bacterium]|nr:hypothetical protein [Nitrospiraceae bacterium]